MTTPCRLLSIVIPCRNEETTLPIVLANLSDVVGKITYPVEILVVDNASTDATATIAEMGGARVVTEATPGYGHALRRGMRAARGEWILFADADGSYNFRDGLVLLRAMEAGADFVTGSRYHGKLHPHAMHPLHRFVGTPLLTSLLNLITGTQYHECNCGMRALTSSAVSRLALQTGGMEIASEMLIRAQQENLRITQVPIDFFPDRRGGPSHLRTVRDGLRHLVLIVALGLFRRVPDFLGR